MASYHINDRATGANNGGEGNDAWQTIAAATGLAAGDTVSFAANSGPYREAFDLTNEGAAGNEIQWFGNGVEVSAGEDMNDSAYQWTASGTSGEYYLELAGGGDPSLVTPETITVAGFYTSSYTGVKASRAMGTAGSLTYDKQTAWGDADGLGFSTLYVKLSVDPSTVEVIASQRNNVLNSNRNHCRIWNVKFTYGNAATVEQRGTNWKFIGCTFAYGTEAALLSNIAGTSTLVGCIGFWTGRRFAYGGLAGMTVNISQCTAYESNIFYNITTGATATTTYNLYGNIVLNGQYGAIWDQDGTATLNEGGNHWYPDMSGSNGQLGYLGTANWATTAATDIPASTATTESDRNAWDSPDLTITDTEIIPAEFELLASSASAGAGIKWWGTEANPQGFDLEPFSDFDTDIGAFQSKHGLFHPVNL